MCDSMNLKENSPQCQYFVTRKKRLCRMTVKPGKHYCGEHNPQPRTDDAQDDTRIPCPYDPKHTCYASKLEKHLSICNARQQEQPDYIIHNLNAPTVTDDCPRLPLSKIPLRRILKVIEKVNELYDTYIKDRITTLSERPIHSSVLQEFNEVGRTESSLRHLRQASSLLQVVETEKLVSNNTSYVELGAGKGLLSYYAWWAWCQGTNSQVLLIDRASLRHKRDNKLKDARQQNIMPPNSDNLSLDLVDRSDKSYDSNVHRIRADLAHLALEHVPAVRASDAVVGFAKHLCGVATDYALRCLMSHGCRAHVRGAVLAACCHHRCELAAYPGRTLLQKLGIDGEDFNTLLGIVSWATCGDGRSRERRNRDNNTNTKYHTKNHSEEYSIDSLDADNIYSHESDNLNSNKELLVDDNTKNTTDTNKNTYSKESTKKIFTSDNPELVKEISGDDNLEQDTDKKSYKSNYPKEVKQLLISETQTYNNIDEKLTSDVETKTYKEDKLPDLGTKNLNLRQQQREEIGRRAKALLDWGRVLFLQELGFEAKLVYYVPTSVSLENVCIVAKKVAQ